MGSGPGVNLAAGTRNSAWMPCIQATTAAAASISFSSCYYPAAATAAAAAVASRIITLTRLLRPFLWITQDEVLGARRVISSQLLPGYSSLSSAVSVAVYFCLILFQFILYFYSQSFAVVVGFIYFCSPCVCLLISLSCVPRTTSQRGCQSNAATNCCNTHTFTRNPTHTHTHTFICTYTDSDT